MILIGYSGHAYVINGILKSIAVKVTGYCDNEEKKYNPFLLKYLQGEESEEGIRALSREDFFIAIGDNGIRKKVYTNLAKRSLLPVNVIHATAVIDDSVQVAPHAVMIGANAIINALSVIGIGVICNTAAVIEHECIIGDFAHIGPGAVLCGNVKIGENSFIGAKSVIRENISIGKNVVIGAGAVVVKNIPDNSKALGNPARIVHTI